MTRPEVLKLWCTREGKKKAALNAPQSRESYATLRAIIGENTGVDLDDIIKGPKKFVLNEVGGVPQAVFKVYPVWKDGKPVKKCKRS